MVIRHFSIGMHSIQATGFDVSLQVFLLRQVQTFASGLSFNLARYT
jgi:hypothetical protein